MVNRDRRRSAASERIDAISKAAVSRRKQNARFPPSLTIHRGRYLACAIRKQNTRRASSDKRIRACSLFAACVRSRANVLVRPAKISRIFLLGINPSRNTGQRVRTENSLDKQPSRHHRPLAPVTLKGAHRSRTCRQFPRVFVSWGRRL